MLRRFILSCLGLLATSTLHAQHASFGVKAGLTASTYYGSDVPNPRFQLGPTAGVLVRLPVSAHLDVQPELLYEQRGQIGVNTIIACGKCLANCANATAFRTRCPTFELISTAAMSSKKLAIPADLTAYTEHQAYIRIFKYKPLNQYDHLLCVHGDRGQGTSGEVAHLKIAESAYEAIAERYPIAERESHLFRSDFFMVADVYSLVQQEANAAG